MSSRPNGYIDDASYHRGSVTHHKAFGRLKDAAKTYRFLKYVQYVPLLILFAIGVYYTPIEISGPISLTFITLIVITRVLDKTMYKITDKNQYKDFDYWIALHYMTEMGRSKPEAILRQNPEYFKAFQEVEQAALEAGVPKLTGGDHIYETYSPTKRIASLVLRDKRSLMLAPQLVRLIKEQRITNYDQLMEKLDQ